MLVAGSMIGSGIFIVSADISRTVGSPFWLLMAWVMAGVVTILGALAYGELAAMYPRAGGQYVFLRESMGPLMGFLYGWTLFVVIQTGTIAAVAVAFGRFLGVLWPDITPDRFGWFPQVDFNTPGGAIQLGLTPQRLVALVTIWILTWINLRGVREGKLVQTPSQWSRPAPWRPHSSRPHASDGTPNDSGNLAAPSTLFAFGQCFRLRSEPRWSDRSSPATRGTT